MKSKEVETWYYKGAIPIKKVIVNAVQLTDNQFVAVDKFVNTWPNDKIPYKTYTSFLRCNRINYIEREENGVINKA